MDSLLSCSIDDHHPLSWNSGELSPSQLSDDEDYGEFSSSFPALQYSDNVFGQNNKKLQSFDETGRNTVPVASSLDAIASLQSAFPGKIKQNGDQSANFTLSNQTEGGQQEMSGSYGYEFNRDDASSQNCAQRTTNEKEVKSEMWELAQTQNMQDYITVCANLQLPLNIESWTPDQTARWLLHRCNERSIPAPTTLCIPGGNLTKMTQRDFEMIVPIGACHIFEDVQIWKRAFDSYASSHHRVNPMQSGCLTASDNGMMMKDWNDNMDYCSQHPPQHQQHMMYNHPMHNGYYQPNMHMQMNQQPQHMQPQQAMMHQQPPQQYYNNYMANVPTDSESEGDEMNDDDEVSSVMAHPLHHNGFIENSGHPQPKEHHQPYHRTGGTVHLWHFIRELLETPDQFGGCVRWVDRSQGTFKIENSQHLAQFWGIRKNRSAMNYDKLSRSLRQYYKKGIIQKPEKKQRLVYRFLPPYNL